MDMTDSKVFPTSKEKGIAFREFDREPKTPDYSKFIDEMSDKTNVAFSKMRTKLKPTLSASRISIFNSPPEKYLQDIDNYKFSWIFTDKSGRPFRLLIPLANNEFDMYRNNFTDEEYLRIVKLSNMLTDFTAIEVALRQYFLSKFDESQISYNAKYLLYPSELVQEILFRYLDGREVEAESLIDSIIAITDLDQLKPIMADYGLRGWRFTKRIPEDRMHNFHYHSTRASLDELESGLGGTNRRVNMNAGQEWDVHNPLINGQYTSSGQIPHTTMQFDLQLVSLYTYLFGYFSAENGGELEVAIRVPKNVKIPWKDLAVRVSEYKKK